MATQGERQTLNEVLVAELGCLRPQLKREPPAATYAEDCTASKRAEDLKGIYQFIHDLGAQHGHLSALCLSGGGIRSATFNLGVIQSLAKAGLLGKFDYLSSVSGGGYIASWLRAWMHREGVAQVVAELGKGAKDCTDPLNIEPKPVVNLREYSNYLTPAVGLFSGDTWSAVATIARNLLLNWAVLVPLMAAVVGIPMLILLFIRAAAGRPDLGELFAHCALAMELIATLLVFGTRRLAKNPLLPQSLFISLCVLPICLAAALLATAGVGLDPVRVAAHPPWEFAWWWSAMPIAGLLVVECVVYVSHTAKRWTTGKKRPLTPEQTKQQSRTVSVLIELSGLIAAALVWAPTLAKTTQWWLPFMFRHQVLYAVLVLPVLLLEYLLARTIFIGVASLNDWKSDGRASGPGVSSRISSNDSDREWWSRLSGWVLLVIAVWLVLTGACLLGCYLPRAVHGLLHIQLDEHKDMATAAVNLFVTIVGVISGAIAALTSSSPQTPAGGESPTKPTPPVVKRVLASTGPVFVICLMMMLAWGVKTLGSTLVETLLHPPKNPFRLHFFLPMTAETVTWQVPVTFLALLLALAIVGVLASFFVNVNRFSLHGMYRNRLVRAYLGASNGAAGTTEQRTPDPFTGFALNDNFSLKDLCSPHGSTQVVPPLSIINTTLNLVNGDKLAWQQRKAESFSMSPLFCGNWLEGYRSVSGGYGGPGGITVGTAVTISGAAANPNMGYSSSPLLGFLMAMFNVRLGAWLGNTNTAGNCTFNQPGPRFSILPMLFEIFGLTNNRYGYVNLSDGGHFDNLGLYEVVLRRCRYVVLSDAGQDGSFSFEDLGNSIRKIRIDFGINVDFERIQILPNTQDKEGVCCAVARIRYSDVDGGQPDDQDGWLVYIKPTLRGRGAQVPYDIYSYSRECQAFPHEPTADQWFSESQFESYRALGEHIMDQLTGGTGRRMAGFTDFYTSVKAYLNSSGALPP
jgi:Patatin-like phospholipase